MPTHRSLNKLEFRAHMSIHNLAEVKEEESHESQHYTRDRLGKKHALSSQDGTVRVKRLKKKVLAAIFLSVGASQVLAAPLLADSAGGRGPNTNVQVTSSDLESFSINDRLKTKDEPAVFYKQGDSSLGINENGDPALTTRF